MTNLIQEEDHIIIRKDNVYRLLQVKKGRQVYFDKQKMDLDGIVGFPYGSTFEIREKRLCKVDHTPDCADQEAEGGNEVRDNRFLVDDNQSQKLSREDIEALKDSGITGEKIIEQLIENSTTFKDKSGYSKVKYLKKKRKKYLNVVNIFKVTTRLLAQMYYAQGPLKIMNLRLDSLAQIMSSCNVHSGGRYLVVENCLGLIVGSVLERLSGNGKLVHVHSGDINSRQTINAYNFNAEQRECLHYLHFTDISDGNLDEGKPIKTEETPDRIQRRQQRHEERKKALQVLENHDLDGLIVASKYHPTNIVVCLLTYLSLSRPFVVFCPYKEPLVDCYKKLKEDGNCVMMHLTENWFRTLQVLPNRTHPLNNMSGSGGYLLTGITAQTIKNGSRSAPKEVKNEQLQLD